MEIKRFKSLLKQNRHYITKPRLSLFVILQERPALTMQHLIPLLPRHDQATVYRNIELFEQLGIINRLRLGWQTKIELSDIFHHHHHHFSCLNCNKVLILKLTSGFDRISNLNQCLVSFISFLQIPIL